LSRSLHAIHPSPHFGSRASRWTEGEVVDLGTLPGTSSSEARSVNSLGHVCGIAYTAVGKFEMIRHGFYWDGGQMQEIGYLPGYTQALAHDLNDSGQVIGVCTTDAGGGEPFVWKNGTLATLNGLIAVELNLNLREAWSINNNGQIAAQATRPGPNGTDTVAVRLTPIPSPIGDSDCDGDIDTDDLLGVINNWAHESPKGSNALPPCDGTVELDDLMIVIDNWSK
jgi:probable HAF family extracellular repeat protein